MINEVVYWSKVLKNRGRPEVMSQSLIFFHGLTHQYNEEHMGLKLMKHRIIVDWLNDKVKIMKISLDENDKETVKKLGYIE